MKIEDLPAEQQAALQEGREQAVTAATEVFRRLDINGDGVVERDELIAIAKQGGALPGISESSAAGGGVDGAKIDEFFETFDVNEDGQVSLEEWTAFFGQVYDKFIQQSLAEED